MQLLLFTLRKLAPEPFLPVGFALACLALSLLTRRRRFTLAAFLGLFFSSLPVASQALTTILESRYPAIDPAACPAADAIVVLGGIASLRHGRTDLNEAADRFESGITLFHLAKAPTLLFTAGAILANGNGEGRLLEQLAIQHGVPPSAIRVVGPAYHTESEAAAVHADLEFHHLRRIILVTSAFHMPRAALLFRRAGIDFTPFPTDYRTGEPSLPLQNWFPSAAALIETDVTLHELYANAFYRLR